MTAKRSDMSTDLAWEEWGRRDPYFGVVTNPKFRLTDLNEDSKREFFESGRFHVQNTIATIRKHIDPGFEPQTVLDFGCGVGRVLVSFAEIAKNVVGLDVSRSMLLEAKRNCDERQLFNVHLVNSDDELSGLAGSFDMIHSFIVLQHIPVQRGRQIFGKLLQHLRPGGVGAIHLTYSKTLFGSSFGVAPPTPRLRKPLVSRTPMMSDPEIQMNQYNMNEILFLLQCNGFKRTHIEFTDHGGELGAFLFFSAIS